MPVFTRQAIFEPQFRTFSVTADPLVNMVFNATWLQAIDKWNSKLEALEPFRPSCAMVVLQGQEDKVVDWRWNLVVLQRILPGLAIRMYPGMCHNLLHERPKQLAVVWRSVLEFFGV
jgi:alpha-beta hydrolase superfamily lysophospholipase